MRILILCCVLAVLALGSWWLFGNGQELAPTPSPSQPSVGVDANAQPVAAAPDAPQPEVLAREAVTTRSDIDNDAPTLPDDATWLEITVVDKLSKQPAPDIDVWWSNETQHALVMALPMLERNAMWADADLAATRFGWHARTDSHGRVRITLGQNGASVIARDATRYARGYFRDKQEMPEGGYRLELQIEKTLHVHVVDAAGGDAAGVRVDIVQHDPEMPQGPKFGGDGKLTDSHGELALRHLQTLDTWRWGPRSGQPVAAFAVAATVPGTQPTPVLIDPQQMPDQPVELRLPATGHLDVQLLFEGQPIPSLLSVRLRDAARSDAEANNSAWTKMFDEDGWARFAHLPLGMSFAIGDYEWSVDVAGPTQPGERVRQVVDLTDKVYVMSGRLLLPDGRPAAARSVRISCDAVRSNGSRGFELDADGRFFWLMFGHQDGGDRPAIRQLAFELTDEQGTPMRASVEPRPLTVGRNELGDVRLASSPLIVAGRLVFDCERRQVGNPSLERLEPDSRPGREGRWQQVRDVQYAAGKDGGFELRGELPPGRYRLQVMAYESLPVEPIEFTPGTDNLQIKVHCGNQAEVTCLLPDGMPPEALRVILVQPNVPKVADDPFGFPRGFRDPSRAVANGRSSGDHGAHRFRWPALPDGTYSLRIFGATEAPLLEIADIALPLPDGGDARLVDIDLRQLVTTLRLKVHTDASLAQERGHGIMAFTLPTPEDDDWYGTAVQNGEAVLAVPPGPVDLLVVHSVGKPVTLHGVQGEVETTVGAWPSVELTFAGLDALPDGAQLSADVSTQQDARPRTSDNRRYYAGGRSGPVESLTRISRGFHQVEGGKVTLQCADNVAQLRLLVRVGRRTKSLTQFTPTQVVAGQPVTVQLSAEELRRVVDELKAQDGGK